MKLVGFVVVGLVVTFVVGGVAIPLALEAYERDLLQSGCEGIGFGLFVNMSVSMLVGSLVTGFLSCPTLNRKWGLLFMAPGLYAPVILCGLFLTGGVLGLVFWLVYYLVSLAGVGVGYLLRAGIRRWVFGVCD
ncbi:MAG: hypothetical protein JSW23_03730 [Planctomycetota bacterium]|nr:MAG: hypothetical protein JSW23_03730 [Planctomycetota bacterium]